MTPMFEDTTDRDKDQLSEIRELDKPSPAEPSDVPLLPVENIPVEVDPLAVVAFLSRERDMLVERLAMTEQLLKDAWKNVPVDNRILREAFKVDSPATCVECGQPTKWRTGSGRVRCHRRVAGVLEMICSSVPGTRRPKMGIPDEVWDILDGKVGAADADLESLDDDE